MPRITPSSTSPANTPRHDVTRSSWAPRTGASTGDDAHDEHQPGEHPRGVDAVRAVTDDRRARRPPPRRRRDPSAAQGYERRQARRERAEAARRRRTSRGRRAAGVRRPRRSLSGPPMSCPSAMPSSTAVSVSWAAAGVVPRSRAREGSAGRYASIERAGSAVTAPSSRMDGVRVRCGVWRCGLCSSVLSSSGLSSSPSEVGRRHERRSVPGFADASRMKACAASHPVIPCFCPKLGVRGVVRGKGGSSAHQNAAAAAGHADGSSGRVLRGQPTRPYLTFAE